MSFVKSCILRLKIIQRSTEIQNEEIVYKNEYNLSFAVGTDRLVVPVLRNSDLMYLAILIKIYHC